MLLKHVIILILQVQVYSLIDFDMIANVINNKERSSRALILRQSISKIANNNRITRILATTIVII
jgi:hypothetical protein